MGVQSRFLQYPKHIIYVGIHVRILLSNDDGCHAEGLRCLAEALKGFAAVTVVAPDRNRSGASNSLTLDAPLAAAP